MGNPPNPIKPGEVRNPTGANQYTYRAEAEKNLNEWCKEYGRDLIVKLCNDAKHGKPYAMKLALERILPAIQKHEIELPGVGADSLLAAVARFGQKGNGAIPERTNGSAKT